MTTHHDESKQLTDGAQARAFILAGNARVTLVSKKTGVRFTYRVSVTKDDRAKDLKLAVPHFVSLLNGADNDSDFAFLGTIFQGTTYVPGRRSRIGADAPSARAFAWAIRHILDGRIPPECEVWHEGRCGRCGRALTVPASIESGLGPECAKAVA